MHIAGSRTQVGHAQTGICNGCLIGLPTAGATLPCCRLIFQNWDQTTVHGFTELYLSACTAESPYGLQSKEKQQFKLQHLSEERTINVAHLKSLPLSCCHTKLFQMAALPEYGQLNR